MGAGGLFGGGSDRRLKTDIKKIGMHHTGIPMYSYRYKGDPKSYPKISGPMAEDVMKIAPHAVRAVDTKGHLAVHMPTLDANTAGQGVAGRAGADHGGSLPLAGGALTGPLTAPSATISGLLTVGGVTFSTLPIVAANDAAAATAGVPLGGRLS